jgi:TRAP-type C4-dicarboxylate transport system substrate-binding protein
MCLPKSAIGGFGAIGRVRLAWGLAIALWGVAMGARAAELRVGTVAPPGTSFHRHLQSLAAEWRNAPGGPIVLNAYPGTQGGEPMIVRRMRVNQLQGAMLTALGLSQIDESVTALQLMPMVFRSWEEVDHARGVLAPKLEALLEKQGYMVLFWGDAGWVRFFSKKQIRFTQDLRNQRVLAASGSPRAIEMMKEFYNPVVLESDKILLGLKNDLIDTVPIPPFLANALQLAPEAPHMLDLKWVPVVGAMVVTRKWWDQLPPPAQEFVRQSSARAGERIRADSRREDDEAIQAMVAKQKLQVIPLTPALDADWRAAVAKAMPDIRGGLVPAELFDAVTNAVSDFRSRSK